MKDDTHNMCKKHAKELNCCECNKRDDCFSTPDTYIEGKVEALFEKANGIADYNWGQEQYKKDIRQALTSAYNKGLDVGYASGVKFVMEEVKTAYNKGREDERERTKTTIHRFWMERFGHQVIMWQKGDGEPVAYTDLIDKLRPQHNNTITN